MKKSAKDIALILITALIFSFATGCSLLVDKGGADGVTKTTLTLCDGDKSTEQEAKFGEYVTVTPPVKDGFCLDGYYDSAEGGTKYIG